MPFQKEFPVNIPNLSAQKLSVRIGNWLHGPKLLKDGEILSPKKRQYEVIDDAGNTVTIKFRYYFIDPVPKLIVNGQTESVAPALKWYEYVWAGWPGVAGVAAGGILGALFGILASQKAVNIFRGDLNIFAKYMAAAVITTLSMVAYIVIAAQLQMFRP